MPQEATQFRNKAAGYNPSHVRGLSILGNTGTSKGGQSFQFDICTGDAAGNYPDLASGSASNLILVYPGDIPSGMRCYVTNFAVTNNNGTVGSVAWAGGIGIELIDDSGSVIVAVPLINLDGGDAIVFPFSETIIGAPALTVNAASTALIVNFAAATFIAKATNSLVGAYVTCTAVAGASTAANLGQTRRITDHGTASLTFATAWPVIPADNDTFTVWSHQTKATTNATTVTAADVTALTTSTMIDQFITTLTGTGPDQTRRVTANTASAMTTGTFATAPDTTTTFSLANSPVPQGSTDFGNVIGVLPAAGVGLGLQVAIVGAMSAGTPLRIRIQGFFAF